MITQGSGPTVLLVPGGASRSRDYWLDLPERLAELATVVTHDRQGTGTSAGPRLPLAGQAAELAGVVKEVGGGPALVVAHSLGGHVAVQLAADAPELVAGLVLLDPTPLTLPAFLRGASAFTAAVAAVERLPRMAPLLHRQLEKTFWKQAQGLPRTPALEAAATVLWEDGQMAQLARLLRGAVADAAALAARLRARPLQAGGVLATADRKPGSKPAAAHRELAGLLGTSLEIWPDTNHGLHLQRPERVVETVRRQLAG